MALTLEPWHPAATNLVMAAWQAHAWSVLGLPSPQTARIAQPDGGPLWRLLYLVTPHSPSIWQGAFATPEEALVELRKLVRA